ncbi:MAG: ATP-dependent helicase HrpB [Blastocatellia bacterium]|jgi:ATP-dependent helicase HrpB|nr:ATP-dependent helicase HrpB [Blastocatellia bacterium]
MQPLPIDALLPEIIASLRRSPNLVIEAPPGAGKTTRVPPALLEAGIAGDKEVWVLEPRRLAARLAARRVAEERGERLGESVGYQVRFEDVSGPRTRLRFLTEGVLTRRLLSDPSLERVGCVVLDEFHERHLTADLSLALLRRLQRTTRSGLRLIAMSATLDAAPVAEYLGCVVMRCEGRRFDVAIEHLTRPDERPLAAQVEAALRSLLSAQLEGDVLVFLPGAAEIRRAQAACAALAAQHDLLILPLHGELPAAEQDRAVRPAERRKVILSTNVAETSVTIEGVAAVIDSGLARIAGHSPWSGVRTLNVARISQSSATQRAGRAGRTRPGRCLRLYTAQDFAARPRHEAPEILRLDLAEPALELRAAGVTDLNRFEWFEAPARPALDAAERLLLRLGALDAGMRLTKTGERMLRLPLHPRLARVLVEGEARGVAQAACVIVSLINERDIRASRLMLEPRERRAAAATTASANTHGPSDLLELLDLFQEAERADFAPARLRELELDGAAVRAVDRTRRQLGRLLKRYEARSEPRRATLSSTSKDALSSTNRDAHSSTSRAALSSSEETELLVSLLTGYPDRVARRRVMGADANQSSLEVLLAGGGGSGVIAPESVVRQAEFLVAVDAEERRDAGRGRSGRSSGETLVRLASAIEPEWLLDFYAGEIIETTVVEWNAEAERVEVLGRLSYDGLVLDETRSVEARGEEVARALATAALAVGAQAFAEREAIDRFLARVAFMARAFPEKNFPTLGEDEVAESLKRLCEGRRSFAELREAARAGGLLSELRRKLDDEQARLLATMAPERVTLASGRQTRVNYEGAQLPWVASRLQDFFGMKEGPKLAGGRVAVVLHLLAPNGRPVQVTQDLAGFWTRHYPQARRELSRRYPRHAWPEMSG